MNAERVALYIACVIAGALIFNLLVRRSPFWQLRRERRQRAAEQRQLMEYYRQALGRSTASREHQERKYHQRVDRQLPP